MVKLAVVVFHVHSSLTGHTWSESAGGDIVDGHHLAILKLL